MLLLAVSLHVAWDTADDFLYILSEVAHPSARPLVAIPLHLSVNLWTVQLHCFWACQPELAISSSSGASQNASHGEIIGRQK